MAQMLKFTTNWTGFVGAPGYTNMYVRDFSGTGEVTQAEADSFTTRLDAFWDALAPLLPPVASVLVDPSVEVIEDSTGTLEGFMTVAADPTRIGGASANYAAPVGAVINWYTNVVRNGRRLKGKTFIVPLAASAYEANGTIAATPLATIRTAANTLVTALGDGRLGVWGRPTTSGGSDGIWGFAEQSVVPDMAAILSSRRD